MERIFDPIRKKFVLATPEERVRQTLLHKMMGELNFPKGLLAVERDLASLPHLNIEPHKDPERRIDLLCFACHIHPEHEIYPLLLVECKAIPLTGEAQEQAVGYNSRVGAPFICLASPESVMTLWYDPGKRAHVSIPFLPTFRELVDNAHKVLTS